MQVPMTEVIAVRRLWWANEPEREVLVSIGKPEMTPGGEGEFYCPIQISGLGNDEFVQPIYGVDGVQAIELAIRFIGWRLSDINAKSGRRLRWEFEENGELPKEWEQKEH